MSFSSYNIEDADQQIITLEIEISQLQKNLVTMKRARNSFTPFCRLPNEILVRILRQMQVCRKTCSSGLRPGHDTARTD
jgi:hypothetical protein